MDKYQVMPNLTDDEYAQLREDIQQRGVMVPIEFDEFGNVLDGHHRLKICHELGIKDYPKVIRAGMSEADKRLHARQLNLARRQLNREQKQELIRQQLTDTPEKSDRQIAAGLGVAPNTVSAHRREMEATAQIAQLNTTIGADGKERPRQVQRKPVTIFNPTAREERAMQNPAVVERMAEGIAATTAAHKLAAEEKAERKSYTLADEIPDGTYRLFVDDIRSGLPQIEDNSVDFIITDPPYPKEYLPLFSDLSSLAARVLKPGGSLIVMSGQSYLPEVIQRLGEHMDYYWCQCYLTPGQSPQLWTKRVSTGWKPLLWYVKGEYKGDYIGDVAKSPANDKRFHKWGQSVGGMIDIIERITNPGDIILDTFLGGGTTGVAAVQMGRKFIGLDIDGNSIMTAEQRIKEAYADARSEA